MSAKNVMNSDYRAVGLAGDIAQTEAESQDITELIPLFSFTAKKNGHVRISCDFYIDNAGVDQTCKVSVSMGRTATALGTVIPYTAQPGMDDAGLGTGHYVILVQTGIPYDVIGTSTDGDIISSGVVAMQYL